MYMAFVQMRETLQSDDFRFGKTCIQVHYLCLPVRFLLTQALSKITETLQIASAIPANFG